MITSLKCTDLKNFRDSELLESTSRRLEFSRSRRLAPLIHDIAHVTISGGSRICHIRNSKGLACNGGLGDGGSAEPQQAKTPWCPWSPPGAPAQNPLVPLVGTRGTRGFWSWAKAAWRYRFNYDDRTERRTASLRQQLVGAWHFDIKGDYNIRLWYRKITYMTNKQYIKLWLHLQSSKCGFYYVKFQLNNFVGF